MNLSTVYSVDNDPVASKLGQTRSLLDPEPPVAGPRAQYVSDRGLSEARLVFEEWDVCGGPGGGVLVGELRKLGRTG